MSELQTRIAKLAADVDRAAADNQGTRVSVSRRLPSWTDHRALFNQHQRRMSQVLCEWPEPGEAVFALHPHRGIAGRLWLSATSELRAGTIGRHEAVDLHLPHDEELSLRHLLVLVRKSATSTRVQVLDLATPSGFQAEQGGLLRSVDANGTLILRAASFSLVLVPTGAPVPWDRDAGDPWSTLPPRVLVADERAEPNAPRRTLEHRVGETNVAFRDGPSEPGDAPLLAPDESVAGQLTLSISGTHETLVVGGRALDRGVILGRYARCAGDTAAFSDDVSRVHAVLVRVGGVVHLVDAGSTNGTWCGEREVKCEPATSGHQFQLGRMGLRWSE